MMLVRCTLSLTVSHLLYSVALATANEASADIRNEMKARLIRQVHTAFQSNNFVAVGTAKHEELADVTYSLTGSVYQSVFVNADGTADDTCSSLSSTVGYAVNYCMVSIPLNFAFKFQVTQNSCSDGITQYFTDKECNTYVGYTSLSTETTCAPSSNPDYSGTNANQNIRCTTSEAPALPGANYIAEEQYSGMGCVGPYFSYSGYAANKCFERDGYYAAYDCSTGKPRLNHFADATCTGAYTTSIIIPTSCQPGDVNIGDDDSEYLPPIVNPPPSAFTTAFPTPNISPSLAPTISSIAFCTVNAPTLMPHAPTALPTSAVPTVRPTASPSARPTIFPTSATLDSVSFSVEQGIEGIDSTTYYSTSLNENALIKTIAGSMTGVSTSAILDMKVVSASRRRLGAFHSFARLFNTPGEAITATYTVSTSTHYSSAQLWNELSTAVSSGAFNTALDNNAYSMGASSMEGCTSSSVTEVSPGSDDSDSALSMGAIIGIAVGGAAALFLIVALIVWLCRRPKSGMASEGATSCGAGDSA